MKLKSFIFVCILLLIFSSLVIAECSETDNGIDYSKYSSIGGTYESGIGPDSPGDYCLDTLLYEYYCEGGFVHLAEGHNCQEEGKTCYEGRCITQSELNSFDSCSEVNEDTRTNYALKGELIVKVDGVVTNSPYKNPLEDSCAFEEDKKDVLYEWYCEGTDGKIDEINCKDLGKHCYEGRCISEEEYFSLFSCQEINGYIRTGRYYKGTLSVVEDGVLVDPPIEDYCDQENTNILYDWYCDEKRPRKEEMNCADSGETCYDGICVSPDSCTEEGSSKTNYDVKGSIKMVKKGEIFVNSDYCIDTNTLYKVWCDGSEAKFDKIDCSSLSEKTCFEGTCKKECSEWQTDNKNQCVPRDRDGDGVLDLSENKYCVDNLMSNAGQDVNKNAFSNVLGCNCIQQGELVLKGLIEESATVTIGYNSEITCKELAKNDGLCFKEGVTLPLHCCNNLRDEGEIEKDCGLTSGCLPCVVYTYNTNVDPTCALSQEVDSFCDDLNWINKEEESPSNAITRKVLVLIYNPIKKSKRLTEVSKFNSPYTLLTELLRELNKASHGIAKYRIVEISDIDDFSPILGDNPLGFDLYETCVSISTDCMEEIKKNYPEYYGVDITQTKEFEQCIASCKTTANYVSIIKTNRICEKVNNNQIDELWIFGAPYFGYYEANMAGEGAWLTNGPVISGTTCEKPLHIMGFNYERGVEEMLEDFAHRMEGTLDYYYKEYPRSNNGPFNTLWGKFGMYDAINPGNAGCGWIHYPPNGVEDYDWSNTNAVNSSCESYLSIPIDETKTERFGCERWHCTDLDWKRYWLSHLPHFEGKDSNGFLLNWWEYLMRSELSTI